jgi:hypothetical protein
MPNRMYVGNIPYTFTSEDLSQLFSEYGKVVYSQVVQDRETGRSRGFGFVEMETPEMFRAALQQANGRDVDGRSLAVSEAREREQRPGGGRPSGGGARPFGGGGGRPQGGGRPFGGGGGGGRPFGGGGGGGGRPSGGGGWDRGGKGGGFRKDEDGGRRGKKDWDGERRNKRDWDDGERDEGGRGGRRGGRFEGLGDDLE